MVCAIAGTGELVISIRARCELLRPRIIPSKKRGGAVAEWLRGLQLHFFPGAAVEKLYPRLCFIRPDRLPDSVELQAALAVTLFIQLNFERDAPAVRGLFNAGHLDGRVRIFPQ